MRIVRRPAALLAALALVSTSVVSAGLVTASPAAAVPVVDVSVGPSDGSITAEAHRFAQVFTAGTTGGLTAVSIYRYFGLTFEIRSVNAQGAPDALLATGTIPEGQMMTYGTAELSQPIPVVAGEQYALVILSGTFGTSSAGYADGALWQNFQGEGWAPSLSVDMVFDTYVDDELTAPTITGQPVNTELTAGESIDHTYTLGGNPAPTTVALAGGSALPDGLTLTPTGRLHGTPVEGDHAFTVETTSVMGTASITTYLTVYSPATVSGVTTDGVVGAPYSASLAVGGHSRPTVSISEGSLPPGLTLTGAGVISGTPTTAGDYDFTVRAENELGVDTLDLSIRIDQHAAISGTAPHAVIDEPYDFSFTLVGDPAPTVSLVDGDLPAGLTLTSAGRLHGTPTEHGSFAFTVEADNGVGDAEELDVELEVQEVPTVSGTPWTAYAGSDYDFTFDLGGFPAPETEVSAGELPAGLELSDDGRLTGVATVAGSYDFTVTATSAAGTATHAVTLVVEPGWPSTGVAVSGDGQRVAVGEDFAPLTVRVLDSEGNPVPGASFTFRVTSGDASFDGSESVPAVTGPDGLGTSPVLTAGDTVGPVTVTASVNTCVGLVSVCLRSAVVTYSTFELDVVAADTVVPPGSTTPTDGNDGDDSDRDTAGRPIDDGAGAGDEPGGVLAETGADLAPTVLLGLALLVVGSLLRTTRRRAAQSL